MWSTICLIDSASPWSREMSPVWNQLKHDSELFAVCCWANTVANPKRWPRLPHSVSVAYELALSVQPCSTTTRGAPVGSPDGTNVNICSAPGLLPKLLTWVSVTGWTVLASRGSGGAAHPDASQATATTATAATTTGRPDAAGFMAHSAGR